MLIVIVIIGVLAAIAIPNIAGLGEAANEEAAAANLRTLRIELESFKALHSPDYNESWEPSKAAEALNDLSSDVLSDTGSISLSDLSSTEDTLNISDGNTVIVTLENSDDWDKTYSIDFEF